MKNAVLTKLILFVSLTGITSCGGCDDRPGSPDSLETEATSEGSTFCSVSSTTSMPAHVIDREDVLRYMRPFFTNFSSLATSKVYGFDIHKDGLVLPPDEAGANHCGILFYLLSMGNKPGGYQIGFTYTSDFDELNPFPTSDLHLYGQADRVFTLTEASPEEQLDLAMVMVKDEKPKLSAAEMKLFAQQFKDEVNRENPTFPDIANQPFCFIHFDQIQALINNDPGNFTGIRVLLGMKAPRNASLDDQKQQITLVILAVGNDGVSITNGIEYEFADSKIDRAKMIGKTVQSSQRIARAAGDTFRDTAIVKYPVMLERASPPW